jgi:transketolase
MTDVESSTGSAIDERLSALRHTAQHIRRLIVDTIFQAQAGHLGGPLSATDILTALYFDRMRIDPAAPDWPERDRFILSKGHSCIALYAVLALRGFFPIEELPTFDAIDSRLQGHPDMTALPGLDMSTGSLGQGLSPGVGMALGAKRRNLPFRTYVMLGDGELQEGQIWEAAFVAARYGLDNLIAIIDHNGLPQYCWPGGEFGSVTRPGDIAPRWEAFGWRVLQMNGHDMEDILATLTRASEEGDGRPVAIVADTVKGKGVSFMENEHGWHAKPISAEERAVALRELGGTE